MKIERLIVRQEVHSCVVGRRETHEELVGLTRREPAQELLEPGRRVLGGAAAAGLEADETAGRFHTRSVAEAWRRHDRENLLD